MSGIGNIGAKSLIQRLRPAAGVEAIARAEVVSAPKALSAAESAIQQRLKALQDTNAFVVLRAKPSALVTLFGSGKLDKGELFLRNIGESGGRDKVALVLNDEGKKVLATAATLDSPIQQSVTRAGVRADLPATLDVHRHVQEVLVDDLAYPAVVKAVEEAAAQGAIPKMIGGKPTSQLFRPSDDFVNDFQVAQFRKDVPGFAQKSLIEQKAIAALAGSVAAKFPETLPRAARHRFAATMVSHKAYDTPIKTDGYDVVGELRDFFHGRHINGRDGQPLRAPETLLDEGFHPDENGHYGVGVYYANASVAAGYALGSAEKPGAILSGKVAVGNMAPAPSSALEFEANASIHTYRSDMREYGDYWVTKDPNRLFITGITRYDPEAAGVEKLIPDLLKSVVIAPDWVLAKLERLDPSKLERALSHAARHGDAAARQGAILVKVARGDVDAMTKALRHLDSPDPVLVSATHSAMRTGLLKTEPQLLEQAAPVVKTILAPASQAQLPPRFLVDVLERFGVDVVKVAGTGVDGTLASNTMRLAIEEERSGVIKALAAAGADVNRLAGTTRPPLLLAVSKKKPNSLQTLLDAGANPHVRSEDGWTALHFAARSGDATSIRSLIKAGVELDAHNDKGLSALHVAVGNSSLEATMAFIEARASLNAVDKSGSSPLWMFAVASGRAEIVEALAKAGADVNIVSSGGETALHWAVGDNRMDITKLLLEAKADVHAKNKMGKTPLDVASDSGHDEIVKLLKDAGA